MLVSGWKLALVLTSLGTALAQGFPEPPPLPSELPVLQPAPNPNVRRVIPRTNPVQQQPYVSLPQFPATPRTNIARPAPYQPKTLSDAILRFDANEKEYHAQPGETTATMVFSVTNISSTNVIINWVRPSCGCTSAKVPPTPWTLKPGEGGSMEFSIDLRGKHGILSKYISVDTSEGQKFLQTRVHIPQQATAAATGGMDARTRNMQLAMVDRQVVFKGDCAKCHSAPTVGKTKGDELFAAACAICHDTPNRASMVPDLRATAKATSEDYWKVWITHGKPGTLMPGFGKEYGGPLTSEQIDTLAKFMFEKFPRAEDFEGATVAAPVKSPTGGSGGK
jgi:mono/diheme cytochrome c family protein